jgi:hypothetical protein
MQNGIMHQASMQYPPQPLQDSCLNSKDTEANVCKAHNSHSQIRKVPDQKNAILI